MAKAFEGKETPEEEAAEERMMRKSPGKAKRMMKRGKHRKSKR